MLILYLLLLRFCRFSYSGTITSTTTEQTTTEQTTTEQATTEQTTTEDEDIGETRRIIKGYEIFDTRPYMVYLRPSSLSNHVDKNWLCGGVIIDEHYILTSAACIEDTEHFYVVSGTHKWLPMEKTNDCILNGAMRAVWKCIPRTYRYDGASFNNIRWMVNDIAVVMTEDKISFTRKVKGCDFIPKKIAYNNMSLEWELPGTKGFLAGWGSTDQYTDAADLAARTIVNSPILLETETIIINKAICKQRWVPRYHSIIDKYMICGKQVPQKQVSAACGDEHVACRQLVFSEEVGTRTRRLEGDPNRLLLESAAEVRKRQKARKVKTRRGVRVPGRYALGQRGYGGFCENDHGGPLVVGRGKSALVVGIISAYRVKNHSKSCYGPFLYTSVYNNRHLIECAVYKGIETDCTAVLRDSSAVLEEEKLDWGDIPRPRTVYEDEGPILRSNDTGQGPEMDPVDTTTTLHVASVAGEGTINPTTTEQTTTEQTITEQSTTEQTTTEQTTTEQTTEDEDIGETRRIIKGYEIFDTRPYMVYLRPSSLSGHVDKNWLCGGVIIDEHYIITSAACIEDTEHFYVVSGTHKWLPLQKTNECITNGAMRAIWKCIPRTYRYDGASFNNIRWMVNDIAVVMTEDKISFTRKVKGCDFIPKRIAYNNMSLEWELPGTRGFLAGWGSTDQYTDAADLASRTVVNSPILLETETIIINKAICKQRWVPRYHSIIDWYMICGKQVPQKQVSAACGDEHVACRQLVFSEEVGTRTRRLEGDPNKLLLESAAGVRKRQKARKVKTRRGVRVPGRYALGQRGYGGFCENDHGGPLVVGRGKSALVVGIISAYRVKNHSKSCYGPFLYTSVYNNRHLIECAVYKGIETDCTAVLRDSSTVLEEEKLDWGDIPRPRTVYEDEGPILRSNDTVQESETDPVGTTATLDVASVAEEGKGKIE